MSIFDKKLNILNEISALKSINIDFPKLKKGKSLPSLNNKGDTIAFVKDLIDILIGAEEFKTELIRFLTYQTAAIEGALKLALKQLLKSKFSCSIDAKIPDFLLDSLGNGFNVAVKQVDFFSILKVDPNSTAGGLIYGAVDQDLNAYLYNVLQGNSGSWKNLLVVTYQTQGVVDGQMKANVFNVKIHSSWIGKTVNDFINAFLDAVIIFTLPVFINKVFDIMFGSIANLLKRNKNSVSPEVELDILVQKIIDLPDSVIDNSYFNFTPDDIDFFNEKVEERVAGRSILKDCNYAESSININDLFNLNDSLNGTSTLIEIRDILENKFTIFAKQATDNLGDENKPLGKTDFFKKFLLGIVKALANILFAPKIMMLFVTYFKVVSNTIGFKDFKGFLEENREIIIELVKKVLIPIILKFLLKILVKHLTELVVKETIEKNLEKIKNYKRQIQSLLGFSSEIEGLLATLL